MASITNGGPPRAGATSGEQQQQHTLMALSRWSILDKSLPPVDSIRVLHVYDFDNTLFRTPLPNPALWSASSMGVLFSQDTIANGGWWHDSRILHATGDGAEEEERRAWAGWWNETIVELVQLSSRQTDALCVLLTGRSEAGYRHLISRILRSRALEFDMVGLKPAVSPTSQTFDSTMHFKQLFLTALVETYSQADQIRVYEDRPKHVKGFRDFFANYNRQLAIGGGDGARGRRGPVAAEIVQVAELTTTLDPVVEVAQVQLMVNDHNAALAAVSQSAAATARRGRLQLRKTVFYTGYMLQQADTLRLIALAKDLIMSHLPVQDLKFLANSVMICPRPAAATVLDRVGGMGASVRWEVTATGCLEDCPLWAVQVRPVPPTARYYTENAFPLIVLALGRGARPFDAGRIHKWQPAGPADALVFDTTVGERMNLHLGFEGAREEDFGSPFSNKAHKRRHSPGENRPNKDLHTAAGHHHSHHHHHQPQQQQQQHHNSFHRANNQPDYGGNHSNNSSAHTSPYNQGRGRGGSAHGSYRGAGGGSSGGGRGRGGSAGGTPRAPFKQYSRGGGTPGGGRGRGRGGGGGGSGGGFYRSLDDVESRSAGVSVSYDDSTPASRPAGPPAGPQGWTPPQG